MSVLRHTKVRTAPSRAVRCLSDLAWRVEQRLTARHDLEPWRMPPGLACREGRMSSTLCRLSTRVSTGTGPLARVLVASLDEPTHRTGVLSVLAVPAPGLAGRIFGLEVRAVGDRIALLAVNLLVPERGAGAGLPDLREARACLERAGRVVAMPDWLSMGSSVDGIAIRGRSDRPEEVADAVTRYAAAFVELLREPGSGAVDGRVVDAERDLAARRRLGRHVADRVRASRPMRATFGGAWVDRYVDVVLAGGELCVGGPRIGPQSTVIPSFGATSPRPGGLR